MVEKIAWWLVPIGALNWLLIGLTDVNVVSMITGGNELIARIIYTVVGLAGVYLLPQASASKWCAEGPDHKAEPAGVRNRTERRASRLRLGPSFRISLSQTTNETLPSYTS